jgi:putative peptidoglycan lipid II flippase
MASRVLGLVREMVISNLLGASHATDAFNVAFRIPNLVRDLFAEGAMSSAFVPTFTARLTKEGTAPAWRLARNVITTLVIVTAAFVVLGMIFAAPLVTLIAGDFADTQGKLELTIFLTRLMLPFLTLVALAAVAMGMLNSLRHFFIPALSPAMFNVASIVCLIGLWPLMPRLGLDGVTALAIGTLVGGLMQFAIQWPLLRREGFHYRPLVDWRDEGLRRMLVLMGPGTVGMAATQVNVLVNTTLATAVDGAPSWLNYAFRLMYLPIGLFGVSIAAATLPEVSRQGTERDHAAMRATITHALSLMLMLNVPATVGLIVLDEPIIRVIFEHGRFTSRDTLATAAALQFYAIGLIGYSVVRIASPVFYALGQSRTPVIVSVVSVLLNAALNLVLMKWLGYRGLALGTSIAALVNALLLLVLLRRSIHGLDVMRVLGSLARIVVASAAMGAAAAATDRVLLAWLPGDTPLLQILRLAADIAVALLVLAGAAWLLRIPEFHESVEMVGRRLRRARR